MAPRRDGDVEIMLQLTPEAVAAMWRAANGFELEADGELDGADLARARVWVPAWRAKQLVSRLAASPGVVAAYVNPLT